MLLGWERMQKEQRLRRKGDFSLVYAQGQTWANRFLVVKARPTEATVSRLGFSVGKRLGGAVVRNRIRRWLREVARRSPVAPGWDVVVIARRGVNEGGYVQIRRSMEELLRRGGLWSESG